MVKWLGNVFKRCPLTGNYHGIKTLIMKIMV